MIDLPKFKNKKLFEQAFIHRSYLNETKENLSSNERLEFLGDSIISFVVSKYLYNKYAKFDEGSLTNLRSLLVNTKTLAEIARELNFGNLLKLSKGEEESKGRENTSLLADSFEAFIGALFLDQEIEEVTKFITRVLLPRAEFYSSNKALKDIKSLLQEIIQAKKQLSPIYKVLKEEGPAHKKIFTVGAYEDKVLLGKGIGKSKQEAEKDAAKQALLILKSK
ncbi:MAG: ribonuclease III [Candidatus Levybacteria bacterium RIFCSPLOWO2_01_FULL_38_21]|nr:MAG: ribonuclease III [Candidatus Levybacteria bacterium RIFCSPLOWO2_01_FULL_38_21]